MGRVVVFFAAGVACVAGGPAASAASSQDTLAGAGRLIQAQDSKRVYAFHATQVGESAATTKKRCRFVKKRIRGKVKRVRVCRRITRPRPRPPAPPPPRPPDLAQLVATIPLSAPETVAVGEGAVWVVQRSGTVARIDPATNAVVAQIDLGVTGYTWIATGEGAVWVTIATEPFLLFRIDPQTNSVTARIRVGAGAGLPAPLTVGEGAVWVTDFGTGTVVRIDPRTNAVVAAIELRVAGAEGGLASPSGIATTPGAVWVTGHRESVVFRIDPATNAVVAVVEVPAHSLAGAGRLTTGAGAVWVVTMPCCVTRIDPQTNAVTREIEACDHAHILAVGLGLVWAVRPHGLCVLDPTKQTGFEYVPIGKVNTKNLWAVAVGENAVWVTDVEGGAVHRLERR